MNQRLCKHCGTDISKIENRDKYHAAFCNQSCRDKYNLTRSIVCKCATCGADVRRRKSDTKKNKTGLYFCSSSCSASYFNKSGNVPKRKPEGKCKSCGGPVCYGRKRFCKTCKTRKTEEFLNTTIAQVRGKDKELGQRFGMIRSHSRRVYKASNKPKQCIVCGYSSFYEVCHIKQIKEFPQSATIGEVNSLDNLIALCPNHHWEFDHRLLSTEDLEKIKCS